MPEKRHAPQSRPGGHLGGHPADGGQRGDLGRGEPARYWPILVDYFDVDVSFLRYNDHTIRALDPGRRVARAARRARSRPARAGLLRRRRPGLRASPSTARSRWCSAPSRRPTTTRGASRRAAAIPQTSMAAAPLVSGDADHRRPRVRQVRRPGVDRPRSSTHSRRSRRCSPRCRPGSQAEEQLRYLAEHDDLTGLYNRRALLAHLDDRLAAGQPGPVVGAVLRPRPAQGDQRLPRPHRRRLVHPGARRAAAAGRRDASLIARLGGDEFVVVPAAPMAVEEAEALAHRLRTTLRERVSIDGEMLTRTVSIGVALGIPGRDTTSDLLRRADQAVLSAKSCGRQQGRRVHRRDVAAERASQRHRTAPAGRHRERRAVPALSARGRHAHRRGPGRRGTGALAAPDPRAAVPRRRSSASPNPSTWQANWAAG